MVRGHVLGDYGLFLSLTENPRVEGRCANSHELDIWIGSEFTKALRASAVSEEQSMLAGDAEPGRHGVGAG